MADTPAPSLIVAHRGSSAEAPENTLPAFELAWQQGADAIEGDFHLTRDREIVCIHNDNTRLLRGKTLTVRKSRLADLKTLDAGSWKDESYQGTRIPTLAEVIATVPEGKKLYIEIKSSPKIIPHLLKQLDDATLTNDQIVIICFSQRIVRKIKRLRPALTVCWLTDLWQRTKGELYPNPQQIIEALKSTSADGVSISTHKTLDDAFVNTILSAGYQFHIWTEDDPDRAKELSSYGVQSITTNTPKTIGKALRK